MTNRIVVLHEDDLKELLERNSREAAAAVLQGLALSLSGGAAAALAAATSRKLTSSTEAYSKQGAQQLLALPGVEPKEPKKKGRPKGAKTGTGPRSGKEANYNKEKRTILPMDAPGDWMTPATAAKFLGISDAAVYFAINRGTLHAKHSEAGSLLVERGQVTALKKERAGVYKKRQEASGKGVPRGGKGRRAIAPKKTPDADRPPVNLSAGWLSGDDAMSTLGLTYAQLKRYRKAGQVKVRARPGPHTGALPPFEFETASVLALRAKLVK